ncbi:MAG TPA: AlpA family phage regulatory protein [Rubrivivax sp.]|nr:AlpA family phage regulatory protein [Rubrivivax sp.]
MQPRYIRIRELATAPSRDGKPGRPGMLPVSAATIWRWVKRGEFPQPVQLGPQTTAWPVEAVEKFLQKREAA